MHVSLTYLRLISANGAVFFFAVNLQIYLETIIIAKNWALASARYKSRENNQDEEEEEGKQ